MSLYIPEKLKLLLLLKGMRMPQYVIPLPSGTTVTYEVTPPHYKAWVVDGFSLSAVKADGTPVTTYDFAIDKGIKTKFRYRNYSDPLGLLPQEIES